MPVKESDEIAFRNPQERDRFNKAFSGTKQLVEFTSAQRKQCYMNSELVRIEGGDTVCSQNSGHLEGFMIIIRGEVQAEQHTPIGSPSGRGPLRFKEGDVLCLNELLHDVPPVRTLFASRNGCILRLIKKADVLAAIDTNKYSQRTSVYHILKSTPVFSGLEELDLLRLQTSLVRKTFTAGEVIFQKGMRGEEMFIIESGSVMISDFNEVPIPAEGDSAREKPAIQLSFPAYFGEAALILEEDDALTSLKMQTRSAIVTASCDGCTLLVLSNGDFKEVLTDIRFKFYRNIEARKYSQQNSPTKVSPVGGACGGEVTAEMKYRTRHRGVHKILSNEDAEQRGIFHINPRDVVRATRVDSGDENTWTIWRNIVCA